MTEEVPSGLLAKLAQAADISPDAYMAALQRIAGCKDATRADFVALMITASKYGLDPIHRQMGLMDTKHGPKIYVSVDGWLSKLVGHEDYLMWRHEDVWSGGAPGKGLIEAVTVYIYRTSWQAKGLPPFPHTEYLRECRRDTGPWGTHPARMLLERAVGQATRFCFGMYIPEAEEWMKMDETAENRGEAAPASAPMKLVPALPLHAQAVPVKAEADHTAVTQLPPGGVNSEGQPMAGGPTRVAIPPTVEKKTMETYSPAASAEVDKALAQGGFDELDFE